MKVARNEKRKKLLGFSFYINIGNFEGFLRNLNLSAKHLFWRCETSINFTKDECSLHDIAKTTCQMDPHKAKLMRYIKNKDDKHLQLHH